MKKKALPLTVKLVSSLTALASLAASIISHVDPMTTLIRGVVAFFAGRLLSSIWCTLFGLLAVEKNDIPETELSDDATADEVEPVAA